MNPVSLKTIFKGWGDALDRRDSGSGYVFSGMTPTAHGAGTLQVDIAAGVYARNGENARRVYAGGNIALAAADALLPRVDIVYMSAADVLTKSNGVAAAVNPVPPAWPAGCTPLAIAFVGPGSTDLTIAPSYVFDTTISKTTAMSTLGDLLTADIGGFPIRLGLGTAGQQLRVNAAGTGLEYGDAVPQPNLCPNSTFEKRTIRPGDAGSLAMPESFADTNGYTDLSGLGAPTVAANILTQAAANNQPTWPKVGFATFWRDGRWSATFKCVDTTKNFQLWKTFDINNGVRCYTDGAGNFVLAKLIAGAPTIVATVAQAVTVNKWYWDELECQGATYIATLYDTGGTVPGVTKASSTVLKTLSGTINDAAVVSGGISVNSSAAAAQWGGVATGNGGVYVEIWPPESWSISFSGVLGGAAVGYNEAADSGPLGKQSCLRYFNPKNDRIINIQFDGPDGGATPSVAYVASIYSRAVSIGSGVATLRAQAQTKTSGGGVVQGASLDIGSADAAVFARKTGAIPADATIRRVSFQIFQVSAQTFTNFLCEFSLPQIEQGSVATPWRPAPVDDAPIVWQFEDDGSNKTTTSVGAVEINPRDLAGNIYMPWDGYLTCMLSGPFNCDAARAISLYVIVDGNPYTVAYPDVGATVSQLTGSVRVPVAQGKHRVPALWAVTAGTATLQSAGRQKARLIITATRGK